MSTRTTPDAFWGREANDASNRGTNPMPSTSLAETAVRSRTIAPPTHQHQDVRDAPVTPADLIYGRRGPSAPGRGKTPHVLPVLDEMPSIAPLPTLRTRMAGERKRGLSFNWATSAAPRPVVVSDPQSDFESFLDQVGGNRFRFSDAPPRHIGPFQVTATHTQADVADAVLASFGVQR
jgi:hypothetical protein